MAQKIVPNLWCDRAEEAGAFYASVLRNASSETTAHYPDDVPDWQQEFAGQPLTVDVVIDGFRIVLINAGDAFRPNPTVSFMLNFDPLQFGSDADAAKAALDETWAGFSEGGRVLMPLQEYPFSPRYGWVEDRYGTSWQLMLTDPDGDPRPFVIPQLMFARDVTGKAREAAEFYASLFEDSGVGFVAEYPEQTGPAAAGDVMFGEVRLAGQWFSMMDSGAEMESSFTNGVSLEVLCDGQAEIDRLWEALSADPEAEQCGWLADHYGLSWQIIPAEMGELMRRPGAHATLISQKKIVIDDY
ncbi:VOC family protein [Microbacterium halophytorum]|uniref:VOC family protein n=1 Tax=Microbacterium halophytorum TaxID=2067568 RepID=UPI000CFB4008|nr:VOC family protein [Microbacterium halophytorum]